MIKNFIPPTVGIHVFDKIRNENRLLIEYVRGSTLYGLNTPESDIDTGGIYICEPKDILGIINYKDQISDERHDNTWYEIGYFLQLLLKTNPNIIEALFVPEDMVIGEIHPFMKQLREHRNEFITKECFKTFYGYASTQIDKARGLNKKIVNPIYKRLGPLDFTYTFLNQGSQHIENWLEARGLKTRYCGLVNIPNMHDIYGVYYDWGLHVKEVENWDHDSDFLKFVYSVNKDKIGEFIYTIEWLKSRPAIGYRGIVCEKVNNTTQLRLSSIEDKDIKPICHISFNVSGFTDHCKKYKDYKEWEKNRNQVRYESNLNKNYDSKNMMHCFRLMHMAMEIARGEGVMLKRTWDHDFLMDVRHHKYEYDELIERVSKEKEEMEMLMKNSTIPDHIDVDKVNDILIDIRMNQIKSGIII